MPPTGPCTKIASDPVTDPIATLLHWGMQITSGALRRLIMRTDSQLAETAILQFARLIG